ncbi:helix-turn-helix domain-containing protein, partial [Duganella vulcania]|uniref:helix-turn-helix domain-containing protein n=1 Tax=Duganella vulcania TaxID=2692166 RepID=UPI0028111D94
SASSCTTEIEIVVPKASAAPLCSVSLPRHAQAVTPATAPPAAPAGAVEALSLPQQVDHHERELIVQALSAVDGNVALAADNLMVPRKTLYDKLKKYQIAAGRK